MNIASYIDHTLLKEGATERDIEKLCKEAIEYGFKGVCVRPQYLALIVSLLKGRNILPITVIGFPSGAVSTDEKILETTRALKEGAKEIDMVINIPLLKSKEYAKVFADIQAVVKEAHEMKVKVIIETSLLSYEEKIIACLLAELGGALFVKTSTGFAEGGATVEDLLLMKKVISSKMKIKASGGIKNYQDALKMIEAGADRLGSSASVNIIKNR